MKSDQPSSARLIGLPPLVGRDTVVVLLGSFPGAASLAAQQYYAHPRNQFWTMLQSLWPNDPMAADYAGRCQWLLGHGLGLWDVYASCARQGSLDAAIRDPVLNDFAALRARCPALRAVAHNGGESFRQAPTLARLGLEVHRLPSTSPAHAAWSFERKCAAWRAVLERYAFLQPPI